MPRYRIDPTQSKVTIDGRSSLHPIHTETNGLEGWLEMQVTDGHVDIGTSPRGHLEFPVMKLTSGHALEDRELQRRIDARKFPTITGDLESIRENGTPGRHIIGGALTFRGVTRRYEDAVTLGVPDDSTMTISGQSVFDIRDFGMEPPRMLMLKVEPEVTVRIDLVALRQDGGS